MINMYETREIPAGVSIINGIYFKTIILKDIHMTI
jgi:hypothetical protein